MIKKKTFKVALLGCLLSLGNVSVWGQTQSGNTDLSGLAYDINPGVGKTVTVKAASYDEVSGSKDELVIPSTVTLNDNGDTEYTVTGIGSFEGVTKITSVSIPKTVTTIADDAFKGATNLVSVTFAEPDAAKTDEGVVTIGAGAFEGTKISTLDLTNTKVVTLNKLFEANNANLKKVVLPASLTTIAASAFENCIQLAEVDFSNCSALKTINNYAFGATLLTTVDLSNTAITTFGENSNMTTPFVTSTSGATNTYLTTVKLGKVEALKDKPVTFIGNAFANCTKLATIDLENTAVTILKADGLKGDIALTELTLPNTLSTMEVGALFGCKNIETLTINPKSLYSIGSTIFGNGQNNSLKTLIIASENPDENVIGISRTTTISKNAFEGAIESLTLGNISESANIETSAFSLSEKNKVEIGAVAASLDLNAFKNAQTLQFTGNITGQLNSGSSPTPVTTVTSVDFGDIEIAEEAVKKNTFDPTGEMTVTWNPAKEKAKKAFESTAFGTVTNAAEAKVTLSTIHEVNILYHYSIAELNNVKFAAYAEPLTAIPVYGPADGTTFWGKFYYPSQNAYIEKYNTDGAKVTVYAVYTDKNDNAVYMDPLRIRDGHYVVEKEQAVVVRSESAEDVIPYATSDKNTMRYGYKTATSGSTDILNDLQYASANISYADLTKNNKEAYIMANPKNGLTWSQIGEDQYVPAGQVYFLADPMESEAPLRIVILDEDGNEEATFINGVETAKPSVENNVIYNLQGVRVDASYKGIVIKNGKKFLQK